MAKNPLSYDIPPYILELLRPLPVSKRDEPLYICLLGCYARLCKAWDIITYGYVKDLVDSRWEGQWSQCFKGVIREPVVQCCREVESTENAQRIGPKSDEMPAELEGREIDMDTMMRWVTQYEMVDNVQRGSDQRFQQTLARLEVYLGGLGARLHAMSNEVIEARAQAGLPPSCSISEYIRSTLYRPAQITETNIKGPPTSVTAPREVSALPSAGPPGSEKVRQPR